MKRIFFGLLATFILLGNSSAGEDPVKSPPEERKAKPEKQEKKWFDRIKINGDFRYRHETIDDEETEITVKTAGNDYDPRDRHRLRARITMEAEANEQLFINLRLVSGSDSPTSTNQTFTNGFSTKTIQLDHAYFNWKPKSVEGLEVQGGKFPNPFYLPNKSLLVWDSDLSFEGMAIKYKHGKKEDSSQPFGSLGAFWLEERSEDDNTMLFGGQIGLKQFLGEKTYFLAGLGVYGFNDMKGFEPFFNPADSKGNTLDNAGNYPFDFEEVEEVFEFGFEAFDKPVVLFSHFVRNYGVDRKLVKEVGDFGYLAGIKIGRCKEQLSWELEYSYCELEKDCVLGALTDSQPGNGGTNVRGSCFAFGLQLAKNAKMALKFYDNDKYIMDGEDSFDVKKFRFDLIFKF